MVACFLPLIWLKMSVPANVYFDDGAEFKREFKELMDFWDIEKQVTRGHAYFAERTIRTIKEAMLRRIAAGAGRRGQWRLMLPPPGLGRPSSCPPRWCSRDGP